MLLTTNNVKMKKVYSLSLALAFAVASMLSAFAQKVVQLPAPDDMLVVNGGMGGGNNDVGTIYYGAVPPNTGTKPVLVFIHGYNSSAQTWWVDNDMYTRAFQAGHRTAFVSVHPDQSYWTNGTMFANMLNTICNAYGVSRVVVIAHSKGGLDSDAALIHNNAWNRVERVITLGSPHFGTPLADLASSGWTSWLGAIFGQNNNATKSLQTGAAANFRNLTDNHPNRPRTNFRTYGGSSYYGWLWVSGVYLSWNGGGSSQCGNDGVVNYNSTRRPNSAVIFGCNDSRGTLNHSDIAKGTPMWPHIAPQLPSSLTREIDNNEITPARFNPTAVVSSQVQFVSADKGKRSFSVSNARQVKIRVFQETSSIKVAASGDVSLNLDAIYSSESPNEKVYLFEQRSPNANFELSSDIPYFAIIETDQNIEATLRTDLNDEKFVYEQGENMNFNVSVSGAAAQNVTGTLLRTSDLEGAEDASQVAATLQFKRIGNRFVAVQKGSLPTGVYNVAIQVQGASFVRHIVTSIAVVASERSIIDNTQESALEGFGIYPNPSNGEAKIYFEIKEKGSHSVNIYDLTGRKVYSQNISELEAGKHQINWQADGSLKNGIYIYELESNGKKVSKKMILNR